MQEFLCVCMCVCMRVHTCVCPQSLVVHFLPQLSSASVFLYHRDPRENNLSADGPECTLYLGAMLT